MLKDYSKLSDEEIIEEFILQKNSALFEILYLRYARKVYHKCLSLSQDEAIAQDLAHDIFLKVFMAIIKFQFKSKFSTWLYSITYNYCIDYVKKNKIEQENLSEYLIRQDYSYNMNNEAELLALKSAHLQQILNKINAEEKAILLMKYQDEISIKEIAEILKIGESAVKMRLARSRQKVLDLYESIYVAQNVNNE